MRVEKVRIKNYKSIVDSGDCYLSSDGLTILAGKNESGKTSFLEALKDFNYGQAIRESARPVSPSKTSKSECMSEITVTFLLSENEIQEILSQTYSALGVNTEGSAQPGEYDDMVKKFIASNGDTISLLKKADDEYELGGDTVKYLLKTGIKITHKPHFKNHMVGHFESEIPDDLPELNNQSPKEYRQEVEDWRASVAEKDGLEYEDEYVAQLLLAEKTFEGIDTFDVHRLIPQKFIQQFVENSMPSFILFSSFNDQFPDDIRVSKLNESAWAQNLEAVSNFRIRDISAEIPQAVKSHESAVNLEFAEKFKQFWTQDDVVMLVNRNGSTVYFWIEENTIPYKPSQRSKGQQWYLSFYVKVVARMLESGSTGNRSNVILIDEPGLYLHARAQKDLLRVLKDSLSGDSPIIFSTHSPYLITDDLLENIRLVEKDKNGTKIRNKLHDSTSKETLTPILTAIGLGINDSIADPHKKDNVVVEGPEDYFYMQAFKELLHTKKPQPDFNFIPGGGKQKNMGVIGSILTGWGANVVYLIDHDANKGGEKSLKKAIWDKEGARIVYVSDSIGASVDLLSPNDFKRYILGREATTYKSRRNSQYLKQSSKDKVLLARLFLQSVRDKSRKPRVVLDTVSQKKILQLFKRLVAKFEANNI